MPNYTSLLCFALIAVVYCVVVEWLTISLCVIHLESHVR